MVNFNRCHSSTLLIKITFIAGQKVPNAILEAETVHDIFVPMLPEKGVKSLSEMVMVEGASWSTALAVCTTDLPGRRRKGSVFCKSFYPPSIIHHNIKFIIFFA